MPPTTNRVTGRSIYLALGLIVLPALLAYTILFRTIVNLPFWDDYGTLEYLIHQHSLSGLGAKLMYALTAQHNEYKLILVNLISSGQYALFGHINFAVLSVLGDLSIGFLAFVLWTMFLPEQENLGRRLALFVPVSWLIFQLSYWETLNWAGTTIQNMYIPLFSMATFALLGKRGRSAFCGAVVCMVLAICTSGNGLIAAFVGGLMLLHARRIREVGVWIAVTLSMALLYAYHYNTKSSQSPKQASIFATLLHFKFSYMVSFFGSLGYASSMMPHLNLLLGTRVLGIALILFFAFESRKGKLTAYPAVAAAVAFILLTGVGVAGLRSDFGIGQSVTSRYRIYSTLLIALAWFVISEKYLQRSLTPLRRSPVFLSAVAITLLLALRADRTAYHYFILEDAMLRDGMALYQHPPTEGTDNGPIFVDDSHFLIGTITQNLLDRQLLKQAKDFDIYQPPPQ